MAELGSLDSGIRVHRTGLRCTTFDRFQAAEIFYPNFYQRGDEAEPRCYISWSRRQNWHGLPDCATSLPSWLCGFDSRRPLVGPAPGRPGIGRLRIVLRTLTTSFVPATCHCRATVGQRSSPRADTVHAVGRLTPVNILVKLDPAAAPQEFAPARTTGRTRCSVSTSSCRPRNQ